MDWDSRTGLSSNSERSSFLYLSRNNSGTHRCEEAYPQLSFSHSHLVRAASRSHLILPRRKGQQVQLRQRHNLHQYLSPYSAIFGTLVKSHRSMATYLAGFRNYAYYHVQAWKCYLHARILRRLNIFQRDLTLAHIEPFALN